MLTSPPASISNFEGVQMAQRKQQAGGPPSRYSAGTEAAAGQACNHWQGRQTGLGWWAGRRGRMPDEVPVGKERRGQKRP